MSISLLGWLFAVGVVVHNTEEALLLPAWSQSAGRWHTKVDAGPFRFAVAALSVAVLIAAWLASVGGARSFGAYFVAGYALAMVLNVAVPHIAASVAMRSYAPGTATALLLNLPLGGALLYRSVVEQYVEASVFVVSGPATVLGILASIPLLFAAGNLFTVSSSGRPPASR